RAVFPSPWRQQWKGKLVALIAIAVIAMGYGAAMTRFWNGSVMKLLLWRREPLTSLVILSRPHLIPENVRTILFPPSEHRMDVAAADARERERYKAVVDPAAIRRRNVIMIAVDCMRADHLPFYVYTRETTPFMSALHAQGRLHKIDGARSICNCTPCGVLSALASRDYDDLGCGLFMLPDLLHDQGWRTHFILAGWHSVWYDLRELYGQSIDHYFEGSQSAAYLPDDDRLLLEGLAAAPPASGSPAFFYFHMMSAHDVGVYRPEYARWRPALSFTLGGTFTQGRNDPQMAVNTYDNKLLMADAIIRELFSALDQKGYLRDSLVVIFGDHGQALGEHDHYSHGKLLYEEDLRVPLLMIENTATPGVRYENPAHASPLDIAPTILDRLSLPAPQTWRGQSLLKSAARATTRHIGCQGGVAVVETEGAKTWKYIHTGGNFPEREELYELQSDPAEQRDLMNDPAAAAARERLRPRGVLPQRR
ncbi:MAG: sulfatase-like hydrolase/transferase, partial [Blastocatellia bacterium]